MSPSQFGRHSAVALRLAHQLRSGVERSDREAEVLSQIDWIISDNTVIRPDVLVVCGPPPPRHVEQTPALVAEIFSESTQMPDQTFKHDFYRQQGVQHYLMLDPEKNISEKNILVWCRQTKDDQWQTSVMDQTFELSICVDRADGGGWCQAKNGPADGR